MSAGEQPRYGTWIRSSRLRVFAGLCLLALAGCLFAVVSPWFLLFLAPLGIFGYITLILALTAYRLGPRGGDFQRRIHLLVATSLPAPGGSALDVGCGSGSLAVKLAQAHPALTVTGVDSWGDDWEYSSAECARNARIEGVADRVSFQQQCGSALSFPDASFDAVVSCMTFHEIKENADKTDGVLEALRVLRPGGTFVFLDLFGDRSIYPDPGKLCALLGAQPRPLTELMPLPFPLRHPKVLGHAMIVTGTQGNR
ncbi:class I SAM-dependent methyltransferase [Actinoplanes sp. KI2]|uniref:class I SAM-dependent methyltransferase n=1 Tax=Actinoplanes sp. KI2 TaxID=2983315 RepID=UPI0021D5E3BA|nr:class I SAM-dependent methyltransferase [Actinoplanes sp. KI2]MCU7730501.1 class I SAM-dependent methyltransferase [Actinoplanes sp. KI2]